MIQLNYEKLNAGGMIEVLAKIGRERRLAPRVSYQIMKIHAKLMSELGTAQALYKQMVDRYATAAEGAVDPVISEENKPLLAADTRAFMAIEFGVDQEPLTLDDLGGEPITAQELSAISGIMREASPTVAQVVPIK